ncbi:MAG: DNA polymerase Y family protein [Terriglobia bacterium]
MSFACIYIPNFVFQAAERSEPELRSCPVAMVEGKTLVVAVNSMAAKAGIEPGMSVTQAAQVASITFRPRSSIQEQIAHAALLDLGFSFSPRVEDVKVDTVILDLAGLEHLLGPVEKAARRMADCASQLGFEAQVAIAAAPEASLEAARGFAGVTILSAGQELERLGSLPLKILDPPAELLETFERWGIHTLQALARLPAVQLAERLGQEGVELQARARGTFSRPLVPTQPDLQFKEVMTLDDPIEQLESLAFALGVLLNRLHARLKSRALAINELFIEMDLDVPSGSEPKYEKKLRLPVPTGNVVTLLKLLQLHLESCPPAAPVTQIRVKAEAAKPRALQGGLFFPAAPDPEKLELTLARLAKVVGEGKVGSPEIQDTHRPDAFRMVRFNPFESGRKTEKSVVPAGKDNLTALRIFRPPLEAKVETRAGLPVRVFFGGRHGEVIAAAGPWRTSGEWWNDDGWKREEWEVELKVRRRTHDFETTMIAVELYRIYRDLRSGDWFLEANYD